jgi:ParB family chromosome partitioning protein
MVAHAIAGSHLWSVHAEPQTARSDAVAESVETCRGEAVFDERRRAVLALLGFADDTPTVVDGRPEVAGGQPRSDTLARIFWRLIALPEAAVLDVVAVVMGESLAAGSVAVEALGLHLGLDMADWWQADAAFFDLIRDREVMTALVADVAGEAVAAANADEKTAAMKAIVTDHLDGANGRAKVERWVPRWMSFPPAGYTARGGVGTVRATALAQPASTPCDVR